MGKRRVVITGMDLVTPIGVGLDAYWKAALAGVSGVRRISHFDPTGLPSQIGSFVPEPLDAFREPLGLGPDELRSVVFALLASRRALDQAGGSGFLRGARAGVYVGTSGERIDLRRLGAIGYAAREPGARILPDRFMREYASAFAADRLYRTLPQYVTARIAEDLGITGRGATIQTACTSSAQAVGEAFRAVRRGELDAALAVGAECIVAPIEMQLFCLLGVLSKKNDAPEKASRPFDALRDGFVLGEGVGALALEELERAERRGATVLAEVGGYGTSCDAYRITAETPDGRGAALAMRRALADAGLAPTDVDYVNAHGTSTPMNDRVETMAIKAVFGPHARALKVSSTKSMIGHTISAAGAIELITTVLALRDQAVPPTINYEVPDPECDLDYVPNRAQSVPLRAAISNSFGFGGHNDCLLVRRP
mgnify:FL=1